MIANSSDERIKIFKAVIGAFIIAGGTFAAVIAVPGNFSEPGALRLSGAIMAFALIAPTFFNWKNDALTLLRGENILLGGLVYWVLLDIIQGAYSVVVSVDAVIAEFTLLGVAGLGIWVGATVGKPLRPRLLVEEAFRPLTETTIFRLTIAAFLLGIWDFLYRSGFNFAVILQAFGSSRWDSPWQREQLGDWSAFSYHLQYFGYMVPSLAVLTLIRRGAWHPATIASAAMAVTIMLLHSQGGGRRIVGAMILSGLFCWMIRARRLTSRRFVIAIFLVGGLLALMQIMLIYRNIGFGDSGSELGDFNYLHVDDNFLRIAQMLEYVPGLSSYVGWQYIVYAIVRPIPRVFWPSKPVDGGFDLAEILGIPDTTFVLTSPGELFISYGYVAVFIGCWIYGKFATIANSLLEEHKLPVNPLFPSLVLVWLLLGLRSMLEIMLMGYVLLAAVLLSRALGGVERLTSGNSSVRQA